MTVFPNLDAKLMGETSPGELVRFPFGLKMLLGLVVGCDFLQLPSGMVIVLLEDIPDRPGTSLCFTAVTEYMMAETCLSYGARHKIIVHPTTSVASMNAEEFVTNGALLVGGGKCAVRSRSVRDEFSDFALLVDTDSWTAVQNTHPQPQRVAVLGWELSLAPDVSLDPPLPPIFVFSAGS
jgi:hypothetical protein